MARPACGAARRAAGLAQPSRAAAGFRHLRFISAPRAERAVWFDGYVRTYLERDLQDLSSIAALPDFRRLMRAAFLRFGQLVNQTELGRDVALPQPTVHRYLNLLETSYLLARLPAYAVNRTKRLIKSPKLYCGDTASRFTWPRQRSPRALISKTSCCTISWPGATLAWSARRSSTGAPPSARKSTWLSRSAGDSCRSKSRPRRDRV